MKLMDSLFLCSYVHKENIVVFLTHCIYFLENIVLSIEETGRSAGDEEK